MFLSHSKLRNLEKKISSLESTSSNLGERLKVCYKHLIASDKISDKNMKFLQSEISKMKNDYIPPSGKIITRKEVLAFFKNLSSNSISASSGFVNSVRSQLKRACQEYPQDDLYPNILKWAKSQRYVSTTEIQSHFAIGYARARRMTRELALKGIIDKYHYDGKPRRVLIDNYDKHSQRGKARANPYFAMIGHHNMVKALYYRYNNNVSPKIIASKYHVKTGQLIGHTIMILHYMEYNHINKKTLSNKSAFQSMLRGFSNRILDAMKSIKELTPAGNARHSEYYENKYHLLHGTLNRALHDSKTLRLFRRTFGRNVIK